MLYIIYSYETYKGNPVLDEGGEFDYAKFRIFDLMRL